MIYIAHRGLYQGPNKEEENKPEQIDSAINLGFQCEVDVWSVNDVFYLGHDSPQYQIDIDFLSSRPLWIHAKNIDALLKLSQLDLNCFWHENDRHTLTSKGFIWTSPGELLTTNSIMVMPEWTNIKEAYTTDCYGICSDAIEHIRTRREQ